jgi:hypothetical protein
MHIVFGTEQLVGLEDRYTILKLDTIQFGEGGPVDTAYCIVENVPIPEIEKIGELKNLHENLIESYNNRNWDFCYEALNKLVGSWNKEVDSFYADMLARVHKFRETPPDDTWTPIILKDSPKSE